MQEQTILVLSTTDWDAPQFGSRQQIALQLVRRGHRVLFVEIPRALHSFISDPEGTRRAIGRMGRVRSESDGLLVYTPPPMLPVYYNPAVNVLNQRLLLGYLRRTLKRLEWHVDVFWTYWPNTGYLVHRLGERVAVYHCIDDFAAAGYPLTPAGAIARMDADQCRKVDIVLTRTVGLAEAKRRFNDNIHLVPGGVDVEHFAPERVTVLPSNIAALSVPRVGLVGTIDDRFDVPLLVHCAESLPQVSFVFVGPISRHRVHVEALNRLPNVHFLPPCPHSMVPAFVAAFDVCLIPYCVNAYTRALSPIKLHECLAMGRPVVSTDLPYVRQEADHIRIARSADEFVAAVTDAIVHPPTLEESTRWRAAANDKSWSRQVDEIERYLAAQIEMVQ